MRKNNAITYLLEFCKDEKCEAWLVALIRDYISLDYNKTKLELEKYVDLILQDSEKSIVNNIFVSDMKKIEEGSIITSMMSLTHNSGAGALAKNQTINFNDDITVVYGLNGSGKSSYFRLLRKAIKGNSVGRILGNIYSDQEEQVLNVDVKYRINKDQKNLHLCAEEKNNDDLSVINIFDSSYTESLLKIRTQDMVMLKPYKLHVFSDLTELIDKVCSMADERVSHQLSSRPSIDKARISDASKIILDKEYFSDKDKGQLIIDDINKNNTEIDEVYEEIGALLGGYKDRLKNLEVNIKQATDIKDRIVLNIDKYNDAIEKANSVVLAFLNAKDEYNKARSTFSAIINLPKVNSEEWRMFVESAAEYERITNENGDNICPYCRREYDDSSRRIVNEYASFLKDKSKLKFDEKQDEIQKLKSQCESLANLNDGISLENDELNIELKGINKTFIKTREQILEKIGTLSQDKINCTSVNLKNVNKYINDLNEKIRRIKNEQNNKKDVIMKLEGKKASLEEKHSLASQKKELRLFMDITNKAYNDKQKIEKCRKAIKKITEISKEAHDGLLNESLRNEFRQLVYGIRGQKLPIELVSRGRKGEQQTELRIVCNKKDINITDILSEGEQKAIALALFLAEIRVAQNKSAIIFDDPITSLDSRIINNFIKTVAKFENQVIIFTHSDHLLSCVDECNSLHFCKNYDQGCNSRGRHVFKYEVSSESACVKGRITKMMGEVKYYMECVEEALKSESFDGGAVGNYIRHIITSTLDEIVFNKQVPPRFGNANSRISWSKLKQVGKCNPAEIDKLQDFYGRISGSESHDGFESGQNPLEKEEAVDMIREIKEILSSHAEKIS